MRGRGSIPVALTLALSLLAGCGGGDDIGPCFSSTINASQMPITLDLLAGWEGPVWVATVTGPSTVRFNTKSGKSPFRDVGSGSLTGRILTVWPFEVQRSLQSDVAGVVGIATNGGTIGCIEIVDSTAPRLTEGATQLLWLSDSVFASGEVDTSTLDVMFAWPIGGDGAVWTPNDGQVTLDELETLLRATE